MAGFAPAYYHESNDAWLNDLVSDIIDPGSRAASRSRSRQDRHVYDERHVDPSLNGHQSVPQWRQDIPSRASEPVSSTSRNSTTSPTFNDAVHYSYRSARSRASRASRASTMDSTGRSASRRDAPFEAISEDGTTSTMDAFHAHPAYVSYDAASNSPTLHDPDYSQRQLLGSRASTLSSLRGDSVPPRTSEPFTWDSDIKEMLGRDHEMPSRSTVQTRTSLGRTHSQKRLSDLLTKPPLARVYTNSSMEPSPAQPFSGFAPHPAVRVFNEREKLGEAAGPAREDDHEYPGKFALTLIVIGICLSVFIISVDRSIVTTAIPRITETFHSVNDEGWYGSAYFLTASAFQPLYGRVYMSFDTRFTFLAALAIFETGSLLGAVSPSSAVLILGRSVQGVGSAGLLTGSFVVATHAVPLQTRPVIFAIVGVLYGVGALAGPLLGGVFTDYLTWRWAFWINLPVGAVTFVAVAFFFKPRKNAKQAERPSWIKRILQLDLIGNAILLGACVMLFLALQWSETRGNWNNAPVIGTLVGFGVSTIIFIGWLIYRGEKALIPPRIMCQRTVASSCGIAFFLYGGLLMHAYYLPVWFQAVKGDSAVHSGVNMIPYMLANALFSLIAGIFVSKNGLFAPPAIIGTAIGTIGCGLLYTLRPDTSTGMWIGYEILTSVGLGLAVQQGFSAVQTALPLEEVPIGTAAVVACQSGGGAVFVAIGNTILQNHLLDVNADEAIPGVDVRAVFEHGATAFRSFVPADDLPALIQLYNNSLQKVFLAATVLVGLSFLCALCMEWRSVKTKQQTLQSKAENEVAEKA